MPILLNSRRRIELTYYTNEIDRLGSTDLSASALKPHWFDPNQNGLFNYPLSVQQDRILTGFHDSPNDRRHHKVYEMVVPAPKWVSISMALAPVDLRNEIIIAHRSASEAVFELMSKSLFWVASTNDGVKLYESANAYAGVEYTHLVSRSLDPHLHSHVLFSNSAIDSKGNPRAILGTPLLYGLEELTLKYFTVLNDKLARLSRDSELMNFAHGSRNPDLRVLGLFDYSKALAKTGKFSSRSADIKLEVDASGYSSSRAKKVASMKTRTDKSLDFNLDELSTLWQERASICRVDLVDALSTSLKSLGPLAKEVENAKYRLEIKAMSNGLDLSHGGYLSGNSSSLEQNVLKKSDRLFVFDEEIVHAKMFAREGSGEETTTNAVGAANSSGDKFLNVPSMQRIYDKQAISTLAGIFNASTDPPITAFFRGSPGIVSQVVLEDFLKQEKATCFLRLADDAGISVKSVGKTTFAALEIEESLNGRKYGDGAVLLLSSLIAPERVAEVLSRQASSGDKILVIDKGKESGTTQALMGRGMAWRTLLEQNSSETIGMRRLIECSPKTTLVLSINFDKVEHLFYESTFQMMKSLHHLTHDSIDRQNGFLLDPTSSGKSVLSTRVVLEDQVAEYLSPVQADRLDIFHTGTRSKLDQGSQFGCDGDQALNGTCGGTQREVLMIGASILRRENETFRENFPLEVLGAIEDCNSGIRGVLENESGIAVLVVDPLSNPLMTPDNVILRRTLNTLGFFCDESLVPSANRQISFDSYGNEEKGIIETFNPKSLFEDNICALRSPLTRAEGGNLSVETTSLAMPKLTDNQRLMLNRRLRNAIGTHETPGVDKSTPGVDARPGDFLMRLGQMVDQLKDVESNPRSELENKMSEGKLIERRLVDFSLRMLRQSSRERLENEAEPKRSFGMGRYGSMREFSFHLRSSEYSKDTSFSR